MQSDFRTACANARASIPVPPLPMDTIRAATARPAIRRRAPLATAATVLSIALIAAASQLIGRAHISLLPSGGMTLRFPDRTVGGWFANPSSAELRRAAETADFPVSYPSGLPAGTTLRMLGRAGASIISLRYDFPGASRRDDHLLWVVLANPSAVSGGRVPHVPGEHELTFGPGAGPGGTRFRVRGEAVVLPRSRILPTELAQTSRRCTWRNIKKPLLARFLRRC